MLMETSHLSILVPAFAAGLLVLASHVLLGRQVLIRGIIFIDLAVAQAAATGALLAGLLMDEHGDGIRQATAGGAALLMVLVLHALEKRLPEIQEALIGGSYILLACIAIVAVAGHTQGGEHISELINGQILWTDNSSLLWLGLASAIAVLMNLSFRHPLAAFYIPFALAITAAVQVVGVYLVFASLIFPALACRSISPGKGWIAGMTVGTLGYAAGLITSLAFDLPSGAVIVIALALLALLFALTRHVVAR